MTDSKTEYDKLFIGGKWTEPSTDEVIEVRCPATGEYVGKCATARADARARSSMYSYVRLSIDRCTATYV